MNNIVLAAQLATMEDSIQDLTKQFEVLKKSVSELNYEETIMTPDDSSHERTRDDLATDILQLAGELGWTAMPRCGSGHCAHDVATWYEFRKNDYYPGLVLRIKGDNRAMKGSLITIPWNKNGMYWDGYKYDSQPPKLKFKGTDHGLYGWSHENFTNYRDNVLELGWNKYAANSRKFFDPMSKSNEQIKDILKRFETIHL